MTFRFLHLADVHLDTPFQSRDAGLRSLLRDAIRQAFAKAVDLALQKQVDAFLVAGDLFDSDTLSFQTEKFLLEEMARLGRSGIRVFYSPGNHDPWVDSSRISRLQWPENVYIFRSSEPVSCEVTTTAAGIRVVICGAAHQSPREGKNLVRDFPTASVGSAYIGLVHALLDESKGAGDHDRYAPVARQDLINKGFGYWALGHVHSRTIAMDHPLTVYPGNLVGRSHRESGAKGAYLVSLEGNEFTTEFVDLAPITWDTVSIDTLGTVADFVALEAAIGKAVAAWARNSSAKNVLLRIILRGPCPLYRELRQEDNIATLNEALLEKFGLSHLEIVSEDVVQPVDPGRYRSEKHILGMVLTILKQLEIDEKMLLSLAPEKIAANLPGDDHEVIINYLRNLIQDLDLEVTSRLVEGEKR